MIGENEFAAAAGEKVSRRVMKFRGVFLVAPEVNDLRSGPQRRERRVGLEDTGGVGKFRSIPEVARGFVEDVDWNTDVEIQRLKLHRSGRR